MKKTGLIICIVALFTISGIAQEVDKKEKAESKKGKVEIKVKEGEAIPLIIIDGKEYDIEILELIDKDKIESVTVLKGEEAIEDYNAANGVIIIKTKLKKEKENSEIKIRSKLKWDMADGAETPVIVIDGEISSKEALDKLSPDDIDSIKVLKNEEAKKKYKTDVGAILIKTKKKE